MASLSAPTSTPSPAADEEFDLLADVLEISEISTLGLPVDEDLIFAFELVFGAEGLDPNDTSLLDILDRNRNGHLSRVSWRAFSAEWHASGKSLTDFLMNGAAASNLSLPEAGKSILAGALEGRSNVTPAHAELQPNSSSRAPGARKTVTPFCWQPLQGCTAFLGDHHPRNGISNAQLSRLSENPDSGPFQIKCDIRTVVGRLTANTPLHDPARADQDCGAWTVIRQRPHEGLQVQMKRRPPHSWSRFRIQVPPQLNMATRLQTEFWIEQLDANCWYFNLGFASPWDGEDVPVAEHTIKFDDNRLRTYGANGVDSGTRTRIRSKTWHMLVVEIEYPEDKRDKTTIRHLVDGELIFTSMVDVGPLLCISLMKAAYSDSKARWANIQIETQGP